MKKPDLILSTAPYLRTELTTPRIMLEVILTLVPVVMLASWNFGAGALLVVLAAVLGAVGAEWVFSRSSGRFALSDYSALLTGLLLGLILPPGFPFWMSFLGGFVGISLGKVIWGGLGQNIFNPALVGRAFLQAAFPTTITTWTSPAQGFLTIPDGVLALPMMRSTVDTVSTATPLGLAKFSHQYTETLKLFLGHISGSIGETSALLLILAGLWLGLRRVFDWRTPISTLLSVALLGAILHMWKPDSFPSPFFMLFSGGLLFGAVYMVTDPVTTPTTVRGAWIFGVGVGLLVVLIRLFGGLPEGVMYAILIMNAVTPYINHYTQPRRFGG